jgi:hypothetical protein
VVEEAIVVDVVREAKAEARNPEIEENNLRNLKDSISCYSPSGRNSEKCKKGR